MSRTRISVELRQRVMENGRFRCGYCLTSQYIIGPLLEIDHYIPEAQDGSSTEDNLCVACPMCNSHKADRISATDPDTATVQPLFNPKNDRWNEHFTWIEDGTVMQGLTPIGRATVAALQVNHPDAVHARRLWVSAGWHPPNDGTQLGIRRKHTRVNSLERVSRSNYFNGSRLCIGTPGPESSDQNSKC
ncbi:HNH endonuclease [Candidatus Gracilibacteria bacterium]|nr:HNH endonuclease [Candidatus Gracilibacteria bacterium]